MWKQYICENSGFKVTFKNAFSQVDSKNIFNLSCINWYQVFQCTRFIYVRRHHSFHFSLSFTISKVSQSDCESSYRRYFYICVKSINNAMQIRTPNTFLARPHRKKLSVKFPWNSCYHLKLKHLWNVFVYKKVDLRKSFDWSTQDSGTIK